MDQEIWEHQHLPSRMEESKINALHNDNHFKINNYNATLQFIMIY